MGPRSGWEKIHGRTFLAIGKLENHHELFQIGPGSSCCDPNLGGFGFILSDL